MKAFLCSRERFPCRLPVRGRAGCQVLFIDVSVICCANCRGLTVFDQYQLFGGITDVPIAVFYCILEFKLHIATGWVVQAGIGCVFIITGGAVDDKSAEVCCKSVVSGIGKVLHNPESACAVSKADLVQTGSAIA